MWLGVIGGSGLYRAQILAGPEERTILTPYGQAVLSIGTCAGVQVAFLARHGHDHSVPPHLVNYRANLWALGQLGVQKVISTAAVGSMNPAMKPGHFVLVDQFIDFTRSRQYTFFEGPQEVRHVDMTEPYCPALRSVVFDSAVSADADVHNGGVYVCTEGPRFETPAEISMLRGWGADVVGMTNVPEVILAREIGLCYMTIAIVTNMAAGMAGRQLTHDEVVDVMDQSRDTLERILETSIAGLIGVGSCECPGPPTAMGR